MAKLNTIKLEAHPRGDSGVIRWSWVKKGESGDLTPLSLVGYQAALTVKQQLYDMDEDDERAAKGNDDVLFRITVDCDNPEEMHSIDPTLGQIMFEIPKKATWLIPGTYYMDIVVENKASHKTTTVMLATLEIQGHPTNRFTSDTADVEGE